MKFTKKTKHIESKPYSVYNCRTPQTQTVDNTSWNCDCLVGRQHKSGIIEEIPNIRELQKKEEKKTQSIGLHLTN